MTELLEEQNTAPKPNKIKHKIKVENYSPHLFWDVDKTKLNLNKHKEYLVKRVLGYGKMSDWNQMKSDLGLSQITLIALQIRDLDPKGANLISLLSDIPIEKFRCYTHQQLIPGHWNF
jgi:hypothetical protein